MDGWRHYKITILVTIYIFSKCTNSICQWIYLKILVWANHLQMIVWDLEASWKSNKRLGGCFEEGGCFPELVLSCHKSARLKEGNIKSRAFPGTPALVETVVKASVYQNRVWRIYSNIRIYWSQIYIRTFVRINFFYEYIRTFVRVKFVCTNIFGHLLVSVL